MAGNAESQTARLLELYNQQFSDSSNFSDSRSPYRRDRDRIYYSEEFQRLENVTQVAPGDSPRFHNRLTHSLKVEQTARSIALRLQENYANDNDVLSKIDEDVVAAAALAHDIGHPPFGHNGEKALQECMERSSDLPFSGCEDSFEGNAQTFHIISLLAEKSNSSVIHKMEDTDSSATVNICAGLNLTKRVLAAAVKYPWLRGAETNDSHDSNKKWGAYLIDVPAFDWVLGNESGSDAKTLEADIMDYADDIAYAVHDVEDFYRAGVIPLDEFYMASINSEADSVLFDSFMSFAMAHENEVRESSRDEGNSALLRACQQYLEYRELRRHHSNQINELIRSGVSHKEINISLIENSQKEHDFVKAHKEFYALIILRAQLPHMRFNESRSAIESLGKFRSYVISSCINDKLLVKNNKIKKPINAALYIEFLKQLTWFYVIDNNRHWSVKYGQQAIVRVCFSGLYRLAYKAWFTEIKSTDDGKSSGVYRLPEGNGVTVHGIPPRLTSYYMANRAMKIKINGFRNHFTDKKDVEYVIARSVADYMCTLSDQELYQMHSEITGAETPSAFIRTLF